MGCVKVTWYECICHERDSQSLCPRGPFTIVDTHIFEQSVLGGRGRQIPHSIFYVRKHYYMKSRNRSRRFAVAMSDDCLMNDRNKYFIACFSVFIPTVFMWETRWLAAGRWWPQVRIYGQICIKPTWRQTRLAYPIGDKCL